jgi:hypothetical protein
MQWRFREDLLGFLKGKAKVNHSAKFTIDRTTENTEYTEAQYRRLAEKADLGMVPK